MIWLGHRRESAIKTRTCLIAVVVAFAAANIAACNGSSSDTTVQPAARAGGQDAGNDVSMGDTGAPPNAPDAAGLDATVHPDDASTSAGPDAAAHDASVGPNDASTPVNADASLPPNVFQKRYIFVYNDLSLAANIAQVEDIITRGAAAGYNGIVFASWNQSQSTTTALVTLAQSKGMVVIPYGLSDDVLAESGANARQAPAHRAHRHQWEAILLHLTAEQLSRLDRRRHQPK